MTDQEKEQAYQNYMREQAYASYLTEVDKAGGPSAKDRALAIGKGAIQAFGVPGGLVRSGIASLAGVSKPEDELLNAPTTSEYLDRAGIPEGAKVSDIVGGYAEPGKGGRFRPEKGGALDPSVRGVAGFAGDVALDPVTYLSGGLSAAAKTGKAGELLQRLRLAEKSGALTGTGKVANAVLNPAEILSRKGAASAYEGAFGSINKKLPKPISAGEVARQTGFVGNAKQFAEHLQNINQGYGKQIGSVLEQAGEAGAKVDLDEALKQALIEAQRLKGIGTKEAIDAAAQIESRVQDAVSTHTKAKDLAGPFVSEPIPTAVPHEYSQYGAAGGYAPPPIPADVLPKESVISPAKANELKTWLNAFQNWNPTAAESVSQQARKAVATPLSKSIKESVSRASPELGEKLAEANKWYASTSPKVQQTAESFAGLVPQARNPLTPTKVDVLATAAAPGVGIAKKLADIGLSARGRTSTGYALNQLGQRSNGKADVLLRQLLERSQTDKEE